jgi:lysozyme family protein
MAIFSRAYSELKQDEGGYVNISGDRGGETYGGISRKSWGKWPGWALIDAWKAVHGPIKRYTILPIHGLADMVEYFYYKEFWKRDRCGEIKSQAIANLLFNFSVLNGSVVKPLQRALVAMGYRVDVDGEIGPQTLTAVNRAPAERLFRVFKEKIEDRLREASKVGENYQFLPEWLCRLAKKEYFGPKPSVV